MSEAATETTSKIVWFELPAEDTQRAQGFYSQLFGWQFQPFEGQDYHVTRRGRRGDLWGARPEGPDGVLRGRGHRGGDRARPRARRRGGRHAGDPGVGLYAHCADTEGNPFGLYQGGAQ